ncbi:MAG TPA: alpha/beta fold hydrolase [Terriglobales bacterium]|nr:alpha/beta fold hydrolase [Terriglobales bacterium]
MAEVFHRSFFLPGPAGRLEAMLWTTSPSNSDIVALVCHPHPLFGGTMHNKVVFQAAKALHRRAIPVLRFNFRGTGQSEEEHDKGRGEQDDVRAGLDFLAAEFPGKPVLLAGFSFGSWVGLRVGCEDVRVSDLIGLGLPVNSVDLSYLRECTKPKLLIQGGGDQFGPREKVEALFDTLAEPKKLVIVENADHFFTGKLDQMTAVLGAWVEERYPDRVGELDSSQP